VILKYSLALALVCCLFAIVWYIQSGNGRGTVAGRVLDQNRRPLGGTSIVIEGMSYSIMTNDSGYFSFELNSIPPKREFTLTFSKTGFRSSDETYFEIPKTDIVKYLFNDTLQP
jgi:Carboxypeptidase regulatory-like domain